MPYLVKHKGHGRYEVVNTKTKQGKGLTTKENAEKQRRLLYAIEAGGFRPRK
jgi:hypothetical protein